MSKSPLLSQLRHHILCLASASDLRLAWQGRHLVAPVQRVFVFARVRNVPLRGRRSIWWLWASTCVASARACLYAAVILPRVAGAALSCSGNHLCRRRPHVLVCGRNASLHARRNIMSTSTCLYHIFSFLTWLYQSVFINMSKSTCLKEAVYINLSK